MEKKQLNGNGFVATIHSNSGLGHLKNLGLDLYRSQVGDRNVSTLMLEKDVTWEANLLVMFSSMIICSPAMDFCYLFVANTEKKEAPWKKSRTGSNSSLPRSSPLMLEKHLLTNAYRYKTPFEIESQKHGEEGRILLRYRNGT